MMLTVQNISPKPARIRGIIRQPRPESATVYNADIEANKSIRIYGTYGNRVGGPVAFDQTFRVGDRCEYDSYNLIYTGEIIAIGPKTVRIHKGGYPAGSNVVLDLYQFAWRNWDFDGQKIAAHNANESYSI